MTVGNAFARARSICMPFSAADNSASTDLSVLKSSLKSTLAKAGTKCVQLLGDGISLAEIDGCDFFRTGLITVSGFLAAVFSLLMRASAAVLSLLLVASA